MNERELSLIKIIGAAFSDEIKALDAKHTEKIISLENSLNQAKEIISVLDNKCASLAADIKAAESATDIKIGDAIKAAITVIETPELPDVAAMVKDAVAAIELPIAPELPDVAAMVKDAVAAIELPAAPELPDVAAIVKDAVAAIELPAAPELPDVAAMVKDAVTVSVKEAVSAIELPKPEAVDLEALAEKAAALVEVPAAPELSDVAAMVKDAVAVSVNDAVSAIEIPEPEAVDLEALAEKAAALVEVPAAPELPDVCGIVAEALTDAMSAIELPKAPELPDIPALVADAVSSVSLPQPEAIDLEALAAKAAALVEMPAAPELPDVAALISEAVSKIEIPQPVNGIDGKDAAALEILPEIDQSKSYKRGTWAAHEGGLWRTFEKSLGMRGWECVVNGQANTAIKCSPDMRTITIAVTHSDGSIHEKHFDIPTVIYRELYKAGNTYSPGDAVTWGGSLWICTEKTADKPGEPDSNGWRLAVKKGRDGK